MERDRFWTWAGVAGVASILCYLLAIFVPWPESRAGTTIALLLVGGFPVFGIVYAYGLFDFVAAGAPGEGDATNRLGLLFATVAFATLIAMLMVQLAVNEGFAEMAAGLDPETAKPLRRALRLVDHGLDVAWDFLIGTSLVFSGLAIRRRAGLGPGWGVPSALLGIGLVVLNALTFPWPPGDRGLVDLGPFIGLFILALATRLAVLGRQACASRRGESRRPS